MNWRTTRLWTRDNNALVIPNSAIAQATVTNYSANSRASRVNIPIVLESDVPVPQALALRRQHLRRPRCSGSIAPRAAGRREDGLGHHGGIVVGRMSDLSSLIKWGTIAVRQAFSAAP
jgi:hypothetical protein